MNFRDVLGEIARNFAAQPLLSVTLFGVIFASVYLLLMLMTRLGDVRRGLQSFILSAVIHLLVILALGEVVPRTIRSASPPAEQLVEIPIREVILEERSELSNSEEGKSPLLEMLPEPSREEFERRDQPSPAGETMPKPEREGVAVEKSELEIPALDGTGGEEAGPKSVQAEIKTGGAPAATQLQIEEETAKAAPATSPSTPVQRQETGAREPAAMKSNVRESTADSKPLPPIKESGTVEVEEKMSPTRLPESNQGLAENASEQKGELANEDPGPTGLPNEKPKKSEPFVRTTPQREEESLRSPTGDADPVANMSREAREARQKKNQEGDPIPLKADPFPGETGVETSSVPAQIPSTYRLRDLSKRKERAVGLGATPQSEQSVERALLWLAQHQDPAGFWDADGYATHCPRGDRCDTGDQESPGELETRSNAFDPEALKNAGRFADTGVTGLVVLCYLGAGYTHEEGKYADQVDRALRWLVRQQGEDGFIGGEALRYDKMYCHGMATLALGEACGMTRNKENSRHLRPALAKAVQYILDVQNPKDGGWRYLPGQRGDMSMFGWQLMALRSAEVAGIGIPDESREKMKQFLRRTSAGEVGGLSAYMPGEAPKRSMTAESLYCRLILGGNVDPKATDEGVAYLLQELPRQSRPDLYYWYYGTLALYHHGGEPWEKWNEALQSTLVESQRKSGHAAGSWDPRDPWSAYGGRLYATTFSVLSLEIYYRFLPLYQVGGGGPEGRRE